MLLRIQKRTKGSGQQDLNDHRTTGYLSQNQTVNISLGDQSLVGSNFGLPNLTGLSGSNNEGGHKYRCIGRKRHLAGTVRAWVVVGGV